jgi:hypothetical protein
MLKLWLSSRGTGRRIAFKTSEHHIIRRSSIYDCMLLPQNIRDVLDLSDLVKESFRVDPTHLGVLHVLDRWATGR